MTLKSFKFGITQISWLFPNKTYTPIDNFVIEVRYNRTNLESFPIPPEIIPPEKILKRSPRPRNSKFHKMWGNYTVASHSTNGEYLHDYYINLTLAPSTEFEIIIYAKHQSGMEGNRHTETIFTSNSVGFNGKMQATVDNENLIISLIMPTIVNNTIDAKVFLILISSELCPSYRILEAPLRKEMDLNVTRHAWPIIDAEVSH